MEPVILFHGKPIIDPSSQTKSYMDPKDLKIADLLIGTKFIKERNEILLRYPLIRQAVVKNPAILSVSADNYVYLDNLIQQAFEMASSSDNSLRPNSGKRAHSETKKGKAKQSFIQEGEDGVCTIIQPIPPKAQKAPTWKATKHYDMFGIRLADHSGDPARFNLPKEIKISEEERALIDNLWSGVKQRTDKHVVVTLTALGKYFSQKQRKEDKACYYALYTGPTAGIYASWPEIVAETQKSAAPHKFKKFSTFSDAALSLKQTCELEDIEGDIRVSPTLQKEKAHYLQQTCPEQFETINSINLHIKKLEADNRKLSEQIAALIKAQETSERYIKELEESPINLISRQLKTQTELLEERFDKLSLQLEEHDGAPSDKWCRIISNRMYHACLDALQPRPEHDSSSTSEMDPPDGSHPEDVIETE